MNSTVNIFDQYIIIDDFYSKEELDLIWKEIDFYGQEKLLPPEATGSAVDGEGNVQKQNGGLFLNEVYQQPYLNVSDIIRISGKLRDFVEMYEKHPIFFPMQQINSVGSLITYYKETDYYKSHVDQSVFTACIWLYREPKKFSGGELKFTDLNTEIGLENNRCVLFQGGLRHEVAPIKSRDGNDLKGNGKYTISHFLKIVD